MAKQHIETPSQSPKKKSTWENLRSRIESAAGRILYGKERQQQIQALSQTFQAVGWEKDIPNLAKGIKNGTYDQLVELETKCPGFLVRLSKEYKGWHFFKTMPNFLNTSIKYNTEDKKTTYQLYPIHNLLLKEKPTQEDQYQVIRELNQIVEKYRKTVPEAIVSDYRNYLMIQPSVEDFKNYLRKNFHMGETDCQSEVDFLSQHWDEVETEANKQGKSEREIKIIKALIQRRKKYQ